MLDPDMNVFPNNVVLRIAAALDGIDETVTVFKRALKATDPDLSIGVFPAAWLPQQESLEIGHGFVGEPTLQEYQIGVQSFIKHSDREIGLALHSVLANRVRTVLYRNAALRLSLESLSVVDGDYQERFMRSKIRNQRYMNNEISGKFVYLSVLDYSLETEIR